MSEAMNMLQVKIGVGADGEFGPNTAREICKHYELSTERGGHLLCQESHDSARFILTQ